MLQKREEIFGSVSGVTIAERDEWDFAAGARGEDVSVSGRGRPEFQAAVLVWW